MRFKKNKGLNKREMQIFEFIIKLCVKYANKAQRIYIWELFYKEIMKQD